MRLCCIHSHRLGDQLDRFDPIAVYISALAIGVSIHVRESDLMWAYLIDPDLIRRRDLDIYE